MSGDMTVSRYLSIRSVQRPFPVGVDDNERTLWSVNFGARADAPVDQWEEEIAQVLVDAELGILGTDIWIGPSVTIPPGDGPYVHILDSGGSTPIETHDGARFELLSCQITVRGSSYSATRTRALAVWRALDSTYNTTITAA